MVKDLPKAPPAYKAVSNEMSAPAAYKPAQASHSSAQRKPANSFQIEMRPAPPVYRPQQAGVTPQQKPQAASVQPQSQYELSQPLWVGNGRQQIQVRIKGAPAPIGSVNVHYDRPGKAFISDLEVNQSHRRHGVATMLMKAAMESARRNGSSATELEARPGAGSISNQALVGMYQKLGFRNVGLTRRGNPKMLTSSAQAKMSMTAPRSLHSVVQPAAAAVHDTMTGRNRRKNVLRRAKREIRQINATRGAWATLAQIGHHDRAIHGGQHHAMRAVRVGDLLDDLQGEIDELSGLNQADNDALHGQ